MATNLQAFKDGYCMFEGNLLEHLNSIPDEKICQLACEHIPSCQYYVYDKILKDCQLLDSDKRQCDLIRGSKASPDFGTC